MIRQLRAGWRAGDVLLCGDWTLLRLFPPLRAAWALHGTQATVPITGASAKRVLFGTINLRTAHRIVLPPVSRPPTQGMGTGEQRTMAPHRPRGPGAAPRQAACG